MPQRDWITMIVKEGMNGRTEGRLSSHYSDSPSIARTTISVATQCVENGSKTSYIQCTASSEWVHRAIKSDKLEGGQRKEKGVGFTEAGATPESEKFESESRG